MPIHRFSDPAVKAAFEAYPQELREALRSLRDLVLDTAAAIPAIGPINECLKWGQAAYRPKTPRTGTTVRIGPAGNAPTDYALFVHCQTSLIADFKELYPKRMRYEGKRAVVFAIGEAVPVEPLKHCIALAFTYYARP